ncbi:MAG TPA: PilZ domain-containing protein [Terriglobales bacterium]|nr:PilZ domain-containing protein [Terriglobales bacterium]
MASLERRQTERNTLEKHAYISIEPNNVGIVLNVSSGGLCFHSIDPIKPNGTIRFGFSDQQRRVEAEGVLVWSDESQKAGVRFTSLSAVARDRVRGWLAQPGALPRPAARNGHSAPDVLHPVDPSALTAASPEPRPHVRLNGFSGGLATGLLVSLLVTCGFVFHGYRHEFGEWLIRTGERFAAKPQSQSVALAAPPATASPATAEPSTVSPPQKVVPLPKQSVVPEPKTVEPKTAEAKPSESKVPELKNAALSPAATGKADKAQKEPERIAAQTPPNPVKPQTIAKLDPPDPPVATSTRPASNPAPKVDTPAVVTPPPSRPSTSVPATSAPVAASLVAAKLDSTPKPEPVSQPTVSTEESKPTNAPAISETFFDVGKFKNPLQAHDEVDKVAKLGFPVTAVQKGFLWTSSYHILVGPYGDESLAKTTHDSLVTDGYNPRTFERGSRDLTVASTLSTGGARLPEGEYVISWESYIGNASVKFLHNSLVVATANAKWVKRDVKYPRDAYVYKRNADGSHTLLEIHFQGMRQALVFGKSS